MINCESVAQSRTAVVATEDDGTARKEGIAGFDESCADIALRGTGSSSAYTIPRALVNVSSRTMGRGTFITSGMNREILSLSKGATC